MRDDLCDFGNYQRLDHSLLERALAMPAAPVTRAALAVEPIPVLVALRTLRSARTLVRRTACGTCDEIPERIPTCRGPCFLPIPGEPGLHAVPQHPLDQCRMGVRDMRLHRTAA